MMKWNTTSVWNIKTGNTGHFSDVPLLPVFFRSNDPKSRVQFTVKLDFTKIFFYIVNHQNHNHKFLVIGNGRKSPVPGSLRHPHNLDAWNWLGSK